MITLKNAHGKSIDLEEEFILKVASSLKCGCPKHLLNLLQSNKELHSYQAQCLTTNPQGFIIHSWLLDESNQLEKTISRILGELLLKENVLDSDYKLNKDFFF